MQLLLARHGEIDNSGGRYIGTTDLAISKNGQQQARDLAKKVVSLQPDICLCSPMLRTRQTAKIINELASCPTSYIANLREIDFGLWEGLTFAEITDRYPDQAAEWATHPLDFTFPEGDNSKDFFKHISEFGRQLVNRPEENILLVTHGGVIRALICHFLGLGFDKYLLFNVRPAGLTILEVFEEFGVLSGLNL